MRPTLASESPQKTRKNVQFGQYEWSKHPTSRSQNPADRFEPWLRPKYALLENEILRLAFRKHPFGFHTGQISARTAEGWKTIAWIPEMGRVASFENSRDVVSLSVCPEDPPLAENQPGSPARLRFSWGPWWDLKIIPLPCRDDLRA